MRKHLIAALAALALVAPLAAAAQDAGPSYADQQVATTDQQIHGRVAGFDGAYSLTVRDEQGYVDNVQLHQGTIINPTGLTLAPGMVVSVSGYNAGSYFAANEIDTPYTFYAGVPYYSGRPWYAFGAAISLGFFFGSTGWWHGGYFNGASYHYYGGARVYNSVRVNDVYRGGEYHGRTYVAPRGAGGYVPHGTYHGGYGGYNGGGSQGGGSNHGGGNHGGGGGSHH